MDFTDAEYRISPQWDLMPLGQALPRLSLPRKLRKGLKPGAQVLVTRREGRVTEVKRAPHRRPEPTRDKPPSPTAQDASTGSPQAPRARSAQQRRTRQQPTGYFANPYNFVPFSTAMRIGDLAEAGPSGPPPCDRAHPERYSAKLAVQFTTVTPLLTLQLADKPTRKSAVYTVRRDNEGNPLVNGASIKGMIRSLYEQVTGSRLGIFTHDDPLSVRSIATDAASLTMIKVQEHDREAARLTYTTQPVVPPTIAKTGSMAPLPGISIPRSDVLSNGLEDAETVFVWLQLQEHDEPRHTITRHNRTRTVGPVHFFAWEPVAAPSRAATRCPSNLPRPRSKYKSAVAGEPLVLVEGTLHITGRTIKGKRHERLFVDRIVGRGPECKHDPARDDVSAPPITLPAHEYRTVISAWRGKLDGFATEVPASNRSGDNDNDPVTVPIYVTKKRKWSRLDRGRTLYCRDLNGTTHLYPALITRESFRDSPARLLAPGLAPSVSLSELTAAERVFGWSGDTDDNSSRAIRGRLRVGGVRCLQEPGRREPTDTSWQLAPLNSPKPSNARFYTRDMDGNPLHGMPKSQGYNGNEHTLAGHKVYPHQVRPDYYWCLPANGWPSAQPQPQVNGRYLNFLSAKGTSPDVAMAIRDWVAPGAVFTTTIYVEDVNLQELSALLWVLTTGAREAPWHLKLGQGKPLGFGSIHLVVDWMSSVIRSTEQTKTRYAASARSPRSNPDGDPSAVWESRIREFDENLRHTAPARYLSIKAAAEGSNLPIYYPRVGQGEQSELAPQVETYQWFMDNERHSRHALPLLTQNQREQLPTNPNAPLGR